MISSRKKAYCVIPERPEFQSRNRGSFDFKYFRVNRIENSTLRFNLVIEVLLISSGSDSVRALLCKRLFQSRNRGSFDFKLNASI